MKGKITANEKIINIAAICWVASGFAFGIIFEDYMDVQFIHKYFAIIGELVENKKRFYSIITWLCFTMPVYFLLVCRCISAGELYFKQVLFFLIVAFIGGGFNSNYGFWYKILTWGPGSRKTEAFYVLVKRFDWIGFAIVWFIGMWIAIYCSAIVIKYIMEKKYHRK